MASLNLHSKEGRLLKDIDDEIESVRIKMTPMVLLQKTKVFESLPPSPITNIIHQRIVDLLRRIKPNIVNEADRERVREIENILRHSKMYRPPTNMESFSMNSLGNHLPSRVNSEGNTLGSRMGYMLRNRPKLSNSRRHRNSRFYRSMNKNTRRNGIRSRSASRNRNKNR